MTTTTDLVKRARELADSMPGESYLPVGDVLNALADALEKSERERDEAQAQAIDVDGWRQAVDEAMVQYERVKGERDAAIARAEAAEAKLAEVSSFAWRHTVENDTAERIAALVDRDTENTASNFRTPHAFGTQLAADIRAGAWKVKP